MEDWFTLDNGLSATLVLIMFSIGATLRFSDFRRIFWRPGTLVLGLVLQMLFLPVFTFSVVSLIDMDPLFKVGFVLVSLCPGGTTSNFVSYLVNADVALSISLTTINSFLILLTIPLGTNLALTHFLGIGSEFHLPFWSTMLGVFYIILLPAFVGLLFNHIKPYWSQKIRWPMKVINVVLLAVVYSLKYFSSKEDGGAGLTGDDLMVLLPPAIFVQVCSLVIAYIIATSIVQRKLSCLTIGIEVGLQNTTLAIVIASVFLMEVEISKPALIYSMFSFFTTIIFALLIYRVVIRKNRLKYLNKD